MRDSGHARGVRDTEFGRVSRPLKNVLYRRTGLSQNFGFAFAGPARPGNPRGAFAPTLLPDFHPEQVCQDRGNYDSLLTPAVPLFRTGGPDQAIRACRLVEVLLPTFWRNPVIPIPARIGARLRRAGRLWSSLSLSPRIARVQIVRWGVLHFSTSLKL